MRQRETAATRRANAVQKEDDHQRWADDGGFTPDPEPEGPAITRSPWLAIAVAAGIGFTLGWLSGRR